jgi:transcription elongation factor Elf1
MQRTARVTPIPDAGRREEPRVATIATLTCPRCGHVDQMTARSYAGWTSGIRCGLCGPPHVTMRVIFSR